MKSSLKLFALRLMAMLCVLGCTALVSAQSMPATIHRVAVVGGGETPEVEVAASGPVTPTTQVLQGPDRVVVDFPGCLPAQTLRGLAVHRGALKAVRTGLFQSNPPITRVVLDLTAPAQYQVFPSGNNVIIKLTGAAATAGSSAPGAIAPTSRVSAPVAATALAPDRTNTPALHPAAPPVRRSQPVPQVALAPQLRPPAPAPLAVVTNQPAIEPRVRVNVTHDLMSIVANRATLSEVLYEVHVKTGADIAIPAGAEQEHVVASLGPAPGKEVLSSLLTGTHFNFIILGAPGEPGGIHQVILSPKTGDVTPPNPSANPPSMIPEEPPPAEVPADVDGEPPQSEDVEPPRPPNPNQVAPDGSQMPPDQNAPAQPPPDVAPAQVPPPDVNQPPD
jgi:hypothetical protein